MPKIPNIQLFLFSHWHRPRITPPVAKIWKFRLCATSRIKPGTHGSVVNFRVGPVPPIWMDLPSVILLQSYRPRRKAAKTTHDKLHLGKVWWPQQLLILSYRMVIISLQLWVGKSFEKTKWPILIHQDVYSSIGLDRTRDSSRPWCMEGKKGRRNECTQEFKGWLLGPWNLISHITWLTRALPIDIRGMLTRGLVSTYKWGTPCPGPDSYKVLFVYRRCIRWTFQNSNLPVTTVL